VDRAALADALVKPGDVIYVHLTGAMEGTARRATLEQDSGAQGSLLAMDNTTGDVLAMVGGRDYALSQFNRATQAERQTGSSFKIYDYTAAIEDGAKPDDIIVDGPVSFGSYTPHNYENDYRGAMTLTNAFAESRNIPALKLAARVGIHKVIDVAHRFGVTSKIPAYLPIAIGAVEITLEEQVASYSVFPNDGIRVSPRLIRKVSNADGITLWEDPPAVNEVISQPTARTMMTLLEGRHPARHRRGRLATEPPAGRQDGHHQRLHRRLVPRLLALGHLRRVGGLRQPPVAGRKGDRRSRRAAHLDDLDARRHQRQGRRAVSRFFGAAYGIFSIE
jgi:membrane peptidoglycan carboxypeptidase